MSQLTFVQNFNRVYVQIIPPSTYKMIPTKTKPTKMVPTYQNITYIILPTNKMIASIKIPTKMMIVPKKRNSKVEFHWNIFEKMESGKRKFQLFIELFFRIN